MDEDSVDSQLSPSNLSGKFGASGAELTTAEGNEEIASVEKNDTVDMNQVSTTTRNLASYLGPHRKLKQIYMQCWGKWLQFKHSYKRR